MSTNGAVRVFLVDDVVELRTLIRLVLEEDPRIEVVGEASNGREGVELVSGAEPDVVLLDLSMPDMDGLEAIPLIREQAPGARLVVLSGHEAGRVSLEALDQGATRYVNKSSDLDTIKEIVHEVAAMDAPFSDARFSVIRRMWDSFMDGAIDEMLRSSWADARWRPYSAKGREFRNRDELRKFIDTLLGEGRVVDPRAYGQEPTHGGLVVRGTLEIRGPDGMSETEVFWAICFHGLLVSYAAGFGRHADAVKALETACPG